MPSNIVTVIVKVLPTPDGDYVVKTWETVGGLPHRFISASTIDAATYAQWQAAMPDDDSIGTLPERDSS